VHLVSKRNCRDRQPREIIGNGYALPPEGAATFVEVATVRTADIQLKEVSRYLNTVGGLG
jgi:hypothetical protein